MFSREQKSGEIKINRIEVLQGKKGESLQHISKRFKLMCQVEPPQNEQHHLKQKQQCFVYSLVDFSETQQVKESVKQNEESCRVSDMRHTKFCKQTHRERISCCPNCSVTNNQTVPRVSHKGTDIILRCSNITANVIQPQ